MEHPDFIWYAGRIRTERDVFALRVHDPFSLALFLFQDVAKNASFFFSIPFPGSAQFIKNSAGHKSGGSDLGVGVRAFLARKWAVILVGRDIFEPAVALQILDALPPGFQDQENLVVAQILKLAVVFGCLYDDFVGTHRLHLIVDSVSPALGIAFHAKERVRVRKHDYLREPLSREAEKRILGARFFGTEWTAAGCFASVFPMPDDYPTPRDRIFT